MSFIKRQIFGKKNSTAFGTIIAVAGADQSVESIGSLVNLDGTGSSSTVGGGVTSYLWEIVSGSGLIIDSPTASTTSISGTSVVGLNLIMLTVKDANGNTDTDSLIITITASTLMNMKSTVPDVDGLGTLSIVDGQPNEVLNLSFELFNGNTPDEIIFSGGIMLTRLYYGNTSSYGNITLDGNGVGTSSYSGTGEFFQVKVTVTGRSSSVAIPPSPFYIADISFFEESTS